MIGEPPSGEAGGGEDAHTRRRTVVVPERGEVFVALGGNFAQPN